MLSENLKNLRKAKGLSQEELAIKLNVVRQTVSKWEKGLSVPDSEMLLKIAEELETTVNVLLGETVATNEEPELRAIAAKLELLNEQFAKRNEKSRKIWRVIFVVLGIVSALLILRVFATFVYLKAASSGASVIGGADGPTSILVASPFAKYWPLIAAVAVLTVAVIGIVKTGRK